MTSVSRTIVAVAVLVGVAGVPASAAQTVSIYLTRGDSLQRVERTVPDGKSTRAFTVRQLLAGPTKAERADGIGSDIPKGTTLTDIALENGVITVRLSTEFRSKAAPGAKLPRVAQLVGTLTRLSGVTSVRVVLGTEEPSTATRGTRLRDLPKRSLVPPVPIGIGAVQDLLAELRYLPARGARTGALDYRTQQALTAFQAWEGLTRDGLAGIETRTRLTRAKTPNARSLTVGKRVEVYRDKGVALLIVNREVKRAIHVSTGAGGITPAGNWNVFRKERNSWSRPFSVNLPYASYFRGGYAFHQYPSVPAYPASHGCIRVGWPEAAGLYEFAAQNTPVTVF